MQISWKGQACFHIITQLSKSIRVAQGSHEQVRIVIDPYDSSIGLKMPLLEADIVLSTHDHPDHNNIKAVRGDTFVIRGPGEYEIKDISIQGISSFHDEEQGRERGKNTVYVIDAEGIRLCHLGDLGQAELTPDQVGQIGNVDILFVPVGGVYTIDARAASKIANQIEPRIVIPMHYMLPNLRFKLEKVDEFLKEMGVKNVEPCSKLAVKVRDFTSEEMKVVLLAPL